DPGAYANDAMKHDVVALLDHLGLVDVALVGYSMGAQLALRLAPEEPRVRALVLLGMGATGGADDREARHDALGATLATESADDVDDHSLHRFRVMAGIDREPLLAYVQTLEHPPPTPDGRLDIPTLLVVGDDDEVAGDPAPLAEQIGATLVR